MKSIALNNLIGNGERVTLECKAAEKGLPKSLWETYSAFANTYGGTILLGVEEQKEAADLQIGYTITNINNPQKLITDFWNLINDPKKVNVNILVDEDIAKVSIVGAGMIDRPGIAADMFKALAEKDINIKMISTSEIKISCLVEKENAVPAIKALCSEFDLETTDIAEVKGDLPNV